MPYIFTPRTYEEFIGNENVVKQVQIASKASRIEKRPMSHTLMVGLPGTGKTTLSQIIADDLGGRLIYRLGNTFDLDETMEGIQDGDILFIDEVHRLPMEVEERLYMPLEQFRFIPRSSVLADMPRKIGSFTFIGATTLLGSISKPLRDRCSLVLQFERYNLSEMVTIVEQIVDNTIYTVSKTGMKLIARASRFTPRLAAIITQRVVEYHLVMAEGKRISLKSIRKMLKLMGIRENGLNENDLAYLRALAVAKRPVGLRSLAMMLLIDEKTLQNVYEPFLLQMGLIFMSNRGRSITDAGFKLLEKEGMINDLEADLGTIIG